MSSNGLLSVVIPVYNKEAMIEKVQYTIGDILVGLAKAQGACCVVIDCDSQHPPEKIIEMYQLWQPQVSLNTSSA